ncbi:MAG: helix-turn-helix domain-containing protein [Spirochaetales bacterium]|nr:helix-turn-helix domain-containing protein [Spirochaetales bacterium]
MANIFRKNLRKELDYQGLTVKELSAKTNIPKGTLDCYLGMRASMPPADAAVKIARVLEVSVDYLVTGQEARGKSLVSTTSVIRSIVQILENLDEKDQNTVLGLVKVLKKQSDG